MSDVVPPELPSFSCWRPLGSSCFLVGHWQERYGTRKMITLGIILTSFASVVVAYASSIYAVYAWAFLNGLASSFVYIPTLTLVQRWYPGKKGVVSGIVSMVFGLSAALMSPLFGKMLVSLGYVSMNLYIAFLTLIIGLAGAYFARAPDSSEKPASYFAVTNRYSRKKPQKLRGAGKVTGKISNLCRNAYTLEVSGFFWITWTLAGAAGVSMTILSTEYGLFRGFSLESAILLLTSFNLTNGASRLISGYFSDKIGPKLHHEHGLPCCRPWPISTFPWADSFAACAFLAAVIGFSFGTLFSVSAPLVADCFGIEHFGAIFWADLCGLRLHRRANWPDAERLPARCDRRQLFSGLSLLGAYSASCPGFA